MTLEESTEDLQKVEANSITLYLDDKLKAFLEQTGTVTIDFRTNAGGGGGYLITVGTGCNPNDCSSC